MNRQQRRANNSKKDPTYTLKKSELEKMVDDIMKDRIAQVKEESTKEAIDTAMVLLFTIPLEVLMDHYWRKSYAKKIPEFTQHILDYYSRWEAGELDMEKLKEDLWEYGGVRFERR